jgi:acetyl esterase/lipase
MKSARTSLQARVAQVVVISHMLVPVAAAGQMPASAPLNSGSHSINAFYEAPAEVPARPGALLRSEAADTWELPGGTSAWRILYTTTLDDGTAAVASAIVLAPAVRDSTPRGVIAWAHGTTGIVQGCAPSLTPAPISSAPALERAIAAGWVVVATDYPGLGTKGPHPFIIGEGQARSVLDAVRAARQMSELVLLPRTVVWGHSQGGHAALWAGIIAQRYAADVGLAGVVAIAPAAEITQLMEHHGQNPGASSLFSFLAMSYSSYYRDVDFDEVIRPQTRVIARQLAGLCFDDNDVNIAMALIGLLRGTPVLTSPLDRKFAKRLEQNAPRLPVGAPLLIAQGVDDVSVPIALNDKYVSGRCAAGQALEYWTFAGVDHGAIVAVDSPLAAPLLRWTAERFSGAAAAAGCVQKKFDSLAR